MTTLTIKLNPKNKSTGFLGVCYSPKFQKDSPFKAYITREEMESLGCFLLADRSKYPWGGINAELCMCTTKLEAAMIRAAFLADPIRYENEWLARGGRLGGPFKPEHFPQEVLAN